jgi:Tol biopolymer transport system component
MRVFGLALAHVLVLACAACTREAISLGAGRGDAAAADAAAGEAEADVGESDAGAADGEFSAPQRVANIGVDGGRDDDPSLSADLTLLFFNSRREGGEGKEDIWYSTRAASDQGWSAARPVEELNTEERETGISLAPDGLSLWFSSDRSGGAGGLDVYVSTRASRDQAWGAPERVPELCSAGDDLISAIADAGRTAYLSRRDDDSDYDLYVAERASSRAAFSPPQPLTELNSSEGESDAFPFALGRRLALTRDGDLWLAERASRSELFTLRGPLEELNSDSDDSDAWLSQDGSYVVFSSDRDGRYALFEAFR